MNAHLAIGAQTRRFQRLPIGIGISDIHRHIGDVIAPNFVNDIPTLQADTYNPNIRFVREDVNYDASTPARTRFCT